MLPILIKLCTVIRHFMGLVPSLFCREKPKGSICLLKKMIAIDWCFRIMQLSMQLTEQIPMMDGGEKYYY